VTAKNYTQLDDREESAGREHAAAAATTLCIAWVCVHRVREWVLVATKRIRFDGAGQGQGMMHQIIRQ
jgi:hypothetical protein